MYSDEEYELTLEERAALAALPRQMAPGELLEGRVVRALRSEGHFGLPRSQRRRDLDMLWKIAAAVALFAGGIATGRYLVTTDARQSAVLTAPSERIGNPAPTPARNQAPVKHNETIVAEREMWL